MHFGFEDCTRSGSVAYSIKRTEVWAADILNRSGMLARVLEALRNAQAELAFIISRRVTEHTSRVFVAPIQGKQQQQAAHDVGLVPAVGMHVLRIEGPDRAGLAAEIARTIAAANVNIRGISAAVVGRKTVIYIAFAKESELIIAGKAVRKLLKSPSTK